MTSDRRDDLPCDELGPDDGVDPKTFFKKRPPRLRNRKALQLCRQAAEALHFALDTDCRDPVLAQLAVLAVEPAPDSSRLLVTVTPSPSAEPRAPADWLAHLGRAAGLLRSAVAAAIHRKRTPELTFRVV